MPTLFIDLDGTIMRNPFWSAVFPIVSEHLAGKTGQAPFAVRNMLVAERLERRAHGTPAALAQDWDDIAQTVARRLGVSCDLSLEEIVISHCRPPDIAMLDEADQALAQVAAAGWQIVAASHGLRKYQEPVLRALGLLGFFTDMATPDTRGCFKQDRAFWLPYLDAAWPAVHLGDLYDDDVLPARRFGMHAIWKARSAPELAAEPDPFRRATLVALPAGHTVRPSAVILHLSELASVLETIERGEYQSERG